MDRICNEALLRKVTNPRAAAAHIKNGMTVGFSGFTVIGYPKVLPAELARRAGLAGERSRFSARYWYSGKLVCGACGGRLTAKRTRRPDGREYLRFVCRGRGTGCAMRAVPGDVLTACVRHVLGEVGLPLGAMAAEVLASARPAGAECGAAALRQAARPGDLILTVGAGDIFTVGEALLREG